MWRLGIPEDRIVFLGVEDNWWAAGPEGPCGPDTEIFVDRTGEPCEKGAEQCKPGHCGCGRFFEVWNNVFMSYERPATVRTAAKNVDTGMGLERTLAVLNGVESVYETSQFRPILERMIERRACQSRRSARIRRSSRRSASWPIISAHRPSSSATRGRQTLEPGPGLCAAPPDPPRHPLLRHARHQAGRLGRTVEDRHRAERRAVSRTEFQSRNHSDGTDARTGAVREDARQGDQDAREGNRTLKESGGKMLEGEIAFRLYDTYGFPVEFTNELRRRRD